MRATQKSLVGTEDRAKFRAKARDQTPEAERQATGRARWPRRGPLNCGAAQRAETQTLDPQSKKRRAKIARLHLPRGHRARADTPVARPRDSSRLVKDVDVVTGRTFGGCASKGERQKKATVAWDDPASLTAALFAPSTSLAHARSKPTSPQRTRHQLRTEQHPLAGKIFRNEQWAAGGRVAALRRVPDRSCLCHQELASDFPCTCASYHIKVSE